MRRMLAFLLCGTVLFGLTGCGAHEAAHGETAGYALYFMEADLDEAAGEGALRAEYVSLPEDIEEAGTQQQAEALLQALLEGPVDMTLQSAVPAGTMLLSVAMNGTEAQVDLSVAYGSLSGVALTLADCAVTLTLTQLPGIMSVKITVHGRELAYRDKQVFVSRDILLAPEGDVLGTVTVDLYFQNAYGTLNGEQRTLDLYEGDTQAAAVVRGLEAGPVDKSLSPVLPEGFRIKSVWVEETVCYVDLSSAVLETLPENMRLFTTLRALSLSLCSLDSVNEVHFLVDGEYARTYGPVDISEPYTEK